MVIRHHPSRQTGSTMTDQPEHVLQRLNDVVRTRGISLADAAAVVEAVTPAIAARALRDAAEANAITIPDALGYKVRAVAVEDLLDRADGIESRR